MDMNGLLSGLASAQGNKGGKSCNNNGNCGKGGFGGGGIIWIIVLLFLVGGAGFGGQNQGGIQCGCRKKDLREFCSCGSSGSGYGGAGGYGGLGGLGGGLGCDGGGIWIIIILLLCFCGGNKNRGCTNNIINVDSDEDC
jgi:hypothetical protein